MNTKYIESNSCNLYMIMIALILISNFLGVIDAKPKLYSASNDTLSISAKKSIIDNTSDSLLQLEVVLKNYNRIPIRFLELSSNSRGEICLPPPWSIIIIKVDSNQQCEPPLLLCNGLPNGVLWKNDEYRYILKLNFRKVFKSNAPPEPNYDFGEYSIQLLFKTKKEVIKSNTIKILYKVSLDKE